MNNPFIMDHPLIQHKISLLRDKNTGAKEFREMISEVAMLMCYEATRSLPTKEVTIETPLGTAKTNVISGYKLAFVPILRAGLGMVEGALKMVPAAKVGHIGIYRDPQTKKPVDYYCKLPVDIAKRDVIVLDPMLATGASAVNAITKLKQAGVGSIKFICVIAAPEGLNTLQTAHPDVLIYIAALDAGLDENAYIFPGLGDVGDRTFGTK